MRRFTIAGGRLLTPMRELNGWMLVVRDGVECVPLNTLSWMKKRLI